LSRFFLDFWDFGGFDSDSLPIPWTSTPSSIWSSWDWRRHLRRTR
jgi:hypothetical protein